jgi:hypothetical protein
LFPKGIGCILELVPEGNESNPEILLNGNGYITELLLGVVDKTQIKCKRTLEELLPEGIEYSIELLADGIG